MKKIAIALITALLLPSIPAFAEGEPDIYFFSPLAITPNETELIIQGAGFGSPFNSEFNEICFGAENCYDATGLNDYLTFWSGDLIKLIVPPDIPTSPNRIILKVYFSETETFEYIQSANNYVVDGVPEPEITSFSPTEFTPSETLVTITGSGFGGDFNVLVNEICYGLEQCIPDDQVDVYLHEWTDTQIQVFVPGFVEEAGKVILNLYSPSVGHYTYFESSEEFSFAGEGGEGEGEGEPEPEPEPEITTFSPTLLTPGETAVTITGTNFGESFNTENNQICFGETCIEDTDTYLTSWTGTEIQVTIPGTVTSKGKIRLKVYSPSEEAYSFIESTDDYRLFPEITSFSPTELTPGETTVTITGYEFGDSYLEGSNQICFGADNCISDEYIDDYLVSWADTQVQVLVPEFVTEETQISLVVLVPTTEDYGLISSEESFTLNLIPDPEITSINPEILIAGETIVTITGTDFGDEYVKENNQICFDENCVSDTYIDFYLEKWSDTEIQILVPNFLEATSGKVGLKVYFPRTDSYDFVYSRDYTVKLKPVIGMYYRKMDTGASYTFTGQRFGGTTGKFFINALKCEITSWSDTEITFIVPENATDGNAYIQSSEGVKSSVVYVEIRTVKVFSNDEYSGDQWHLGAINIEQAWEITEGSSDIIVGIVDSGIDINHEDLRHAIWTNGDEIANNGVDDDHNGYIDDVHGWDFVLNSNNTAPRGPHGTMVSSLIAAAKDNSVGMAGIAPNVKIIPLNIALHDGLSVSVDGALHAIKYAVDNGAHIINLSFRGFGTDTFYDEIIKYAYDNNVLVVAATGNDGVDLDFMPAQPACTDVGRNAVIGVAATDKSNIVSWFSNYGANCTDISAPGENILLAIPTSMGEYAYNEGTSFSSPITAGVAALIKSKNPSWNVEEIKYVLLNTAKNIDINNPLYAGKLGEGIPDTHAALQASRPDVSYNYNPTTHVDIEETGQEIGIEIPEPEPVKEEEPIKNEEIEKMEEAQEEKDTEETQPQHEEETNNNGEISPPITPFPDTTGHKYETAITFIKGKRLVHGYPDSTFKPDKVINRAEFTKIIMNAMQEMPEGNFCFPDVNDDWFAIFVCGAQKLGIIQGYPDGFFRPGQTVNTVEALKIVLEAAGVDVHAAYYTPEGGDWFAPYVMYALNTNLNFILYENSFDQPVTRGQMAELVYRVLEE